MATISSAGIGSGLDVDSIVTKLMDIEKQPLTTLQTQASTLNSKISAFGTLKSQMSTLNDAVARLALPATWNARTVSSSNNSAVSVSTSGDSSTATSFSMEVSQLARAQSVASNAVLAGSGFGAGTLSIQLGNWSSGAAPAFTAGTAPAVSVTVAEGDSMSTIASKVNAAGAGVTATVMKDLSGERLLMRSLTTGEAAGFRVQATDDAAATGPSLSAFAFDNPAAGAGMAANTIQYGLNAKATINGVPITSGSNKLADTVPGLSITLSQVTTAPVEITASVDTASQTAAVNAFVKAYNSMNEMLNQATAYNPTTKTGALLQGDATTTGLQTAMRSLIGAMSGGGTLQRLSDLGVSIAKDGAGDLAVDSTKLAAALADPKAVSQFFTAPANDANGSTGFATRLAGFIGFAIGATGTLATKTGSLQSQKTANRKDQDNLNDRLTLVEARMRKQYTTLDTTMSSLNALNAYVTQQIAQWNKAKA